MRWNLFWRRRICINVSMYLCLSVCMYVSMYVCIYNISGCLADPENPEMSLVKFAFRWYLVIFSELETGDRTILIITITSFYTFNHHIPENCEIVMEKLHLKLLLDTLHIIYMICIIYVTYICINDICYILIIYFYNIF